MTDTPHTPPNNPGEFITGNTSHPRTRNTPASRRTRIRGCGVPATVWFAPRPQSPGAEAVPDPTGPHEAEDWALAETIRQFTTPDQNYLVSHLAYPGCLGNNSSRGHHPGYLPDRDPVAAANDLFEPHALHVVIPVPSDGDCGGARRWHGTTPGQAFLARLQYHIDDAETNLADGGILAVLLPRPRPGAHFADDTGAVIRAARDGGLAYLQHIAVVDAFIDHEGITATPAPGVLDAFRTARESGLPVHARSHSDLLIFRKSREEAASLD